MAIILKKITPMFNGVITTANRYEEKECYYGGLLDANMVGVLKTYQTVVALAPMLEQRGLKIGDVVNISFLRYLKTTQARETAGLQDSLDENYGVRKHFEVPIVNINDEDHLKIFYEDIEYVIDEFETYTPEPLIIDKQTPKFIIPEKNIIPENIPKIDLS